MEWVGQQVADLGLAEKHVLEVGSKDENGTVRDFFHRGYVGVDIRDGKGVDQIAHAAHLPFAARSFEVVVSTEMLEHDTLPWRSLSEMRRVLKRGGVLLLTCRGFNPAGCFGYHGYPDDYWRFTVGGMTAMLRDVGFRAPEVIPDPQFPGVFVLARKGG